MKKIHEMREKKIIETYVSNDNTALINANLDQITGYDLHSSTNKLTKAVLPLPTSHFFPLVNFSKWIYTFWV